MSEFNPNPDYESTDSINEKDSAHENETLAADAEQIATQEKKPRLFSELFDYLEVIVIAICAVVLLFSFGFRWCRVQGDSMMTTLFNGEALIISDAFYTPQREDIIVFHQTGNLNEAVVKRVIATEGQTVHIDFENGIVYVDGKEIHEPYILGSTTMEEGVRFPLTVDEGCVFVLGDNRDDSKDSRDPEIGLIDKREIMGKVVFLFFPGQDRFQQRDFGRIGVVS